MLLMIVLIRDMWRENTARSERDKRKFQPLGRGFGHGRERHAQNARDARNARSEATDSLHGVGSSTATSKRQRTKPLISGRIELPTFVFTEYPRVL